MQTITARRLRWLAPFVAGAAVAAAAVLPGVAAGSDHPTLPARTAAQLLADLATIKPAELSGTLVETARLGLPQLPSTGSSAAELSLANLVTGSHTARVWLDGAGHQRFALVGDLAESDVVHNGDEVWVYSSSANQATHVVFPAGTAKKTTQDLTPRAVPTPAEIAAQVLAAVSPTTRVSVDDTARVAGRSAYQLVLSPKDAHALITSVTIAIDSRTKVPLRIQVFGHDRSTPAFETGFTDISYATPPASVFRFIPPTGARVVQSTPSALLAGGTGLGHGATTGAAGARPLPVPGDDTTKATRVIGTGWTAVVETEGSALTGAGSGRVESNPLTSVLLRSATKVPGGRLVSTALFSALLTDDGHLYVGAVDGAALQKAAATGQPV